MSVTGAAIGALVLALALCACGKANPYACTASGECELGGQQGMCVAGYCAFADPGCAGGYRYEANAGGGLAGTCAAGDAGVDAPIDAPGATCIADVVFGRRFACVRKTGGSVWCAGENARGQLGNGTAGAPNATWGQVRDSAAAAIGDATSISGGREHACAVRAGGTVWCWGANENGELGNAAMLGSASPPDQPSAVQVMKSGGAPLTGIVEIAASYNHTCGRDDAGGVWCWGGNGSGTLGDGTTTNRSVAAPVLVAAGGASFTGATQLAVGGGGMSCARKSNNDVWCWGLNSDGEFGDGTKNNHTSPVMVATAASFAPGMYHACYVASDSSIECQGWNGHARLGNGSGVGYQDGDYVVPVHVVTAAGGANFMGATQIAAGAVTCALDSGGHVWCWGDDQYGQVGTGTGEVVPVQVLASGGKPLAGADRVVAHFAHACAHDTDGTWRCWGRGTEGEFGDGTYRDRGFAQALEVACP